MSKSRFVDFRAVKGAVTIVQVLQHYDWMSRLHQTGDSLTGPCPIHGGDNPTAFRVSLSKNCWNCFSRCGGGGNVLDLVARKEKLSLLQAANLLVEWFHLDLPDEGSAKRPGPAHPAPSTAPPSSPAPSPSASPVKDEAKGVNSVMNFELKQLQPDHPYLAERGLTAETVQTFGLGFCPKGLLAGRIAIPIHNVDGKLVAYAGRWPGCPPDGKEKYKLPPGFKKSLELFNLHRALAANGDSPLVVVEGFFDCLHLWQHGLKRVVALMGSSLSSAQEALLAQHLGSEDRVIVMLDEDDAGRRGRDDIALRLARLAYVRVHRFGKDGAQPDSLSGDEVGAIRGGAV
jgi:DNA primase